MKTTSLQNNRLLLITNILITTHTFPSIVNIISQGVTSYYNGKYIMGTSHFDVRDLKIAQHQNAIEWDNFARGRMSKKIQRKIAAHYKKT